MKIKTKAYFFGLNSNPELFTTWLELNAFGFTIRA